MQANNACGHFQAQDFAKSAGGNVFANFRILLLCMAAGFLLATVFTSPGGAVAGAIKGLLLGTLIVCGEWKANRTKGGALKSASA